ncbi:hypothetical protein LDENG_00125160 [Lucifuga dentata]|nr:hypothetical protein LDENG_00125160 [Lucifuga dentata]
MAQSSQAAATETISPSTKTWTGPTTCGTHSESLPGFYCRQKPGNWPEQEQPENRSQGRDAYSLSGSDMRTLQHQMSHDDRNKQVSEAGFGSGTEEETSGYESEGGRSLSPAAPESASTSPSSPPSGRRPRTAFTAEQISSLEKAFKRNIRNWFQNRRMKLKRTVQDALAHTCQASQVLYYPELHLCRPGPCPGYHSAQESPATAAYFHPLSIHPHSVHYSSPLPAVSTSPLDSFYQHSSLPGGLVLPSEASHLMGSYPKYPHYY